MLKFNGKLVLAAAAFVTIGVGVASDARAEEFTYVIDPARSSLLATGDLTAEEPNGNTASQQSAGSLITSYSGSIVLDRTGNTIIFDGGSSLIAAIGGNYRPDNDGFDDTDPANYGRTAPGPFGTTTYEAIRDLQFDLFDDTSGLGATVAPNGDFLSNSFGLEVESGESDTMFGLGGSPDLSLVGKGTANGTDGGPSSLVYDSSSGVETLTLKIATGAIGYNVNQNGDSSLIFNGTIVATRVPEPGAISLIALSGAAALAPRRRRRRLS